LTVDSRRTPVYADVYRHVNEASAAFEMHVPPKHDVALQKSELVLAIRARDEERLKKIRIERELDELVAVRIFELARAISQNGVREFEVAVVELIQMGMPQQAEVVASFENIW
jgi:hypothetical protein